MSGATLRTSQPHSSPPPSSAVQELIQRPRQVRVESNSPGAPWHPLRHLRGLLPSPGASGPRAPSCLFTHFPEQPGCLTSGHTMQPCILEPPTPSPEGQRAQEVEGNAAAGPLEERGGKSGQSFCRTSWRQTGGRGFQVGPASPCTPGHPSSVRSSPMASFRLATGAWEGLRSRGSG